MKLCVRMKWKIKLKYVKKKKQKTLMSHEKH